MDICHAVGQLLGKQLFFFGRAEPFKKYKEWTWEAVEESRPGHGGHAVVRRRSLDQPDSDGDSRNPFVSGDDADFVACASERQNREGKAERV